MILLAAAQHDAPVVGNNPSMATYQAVLQTTKPIQGQITGVSNENGTGVNFNINFYEFDADQGPFGMLLTLEKTTYTNLLPSSLSHP